jgi:hypothetical protein
MYTQGARILRLRNKSRLLGEQEYCVQGTNLMYSGTRNIASEEQIMYTQGTRILPPRNKSRVLGEQKYCVRETYIVY